MGMECGDRDPAEAFLQPTKADYVRTVADLEVPRGGWPLVFIYRNHRGEVDARHATVRRVSYATSSWHPGGTLWMMKAWDEEKQAERDFAIAEMQPVAGMGMKYGQESLVVAMLRAMAARYKAAVPALAAGEVWEHVMATWESDCWDPGDRTVEKAVDAVDADLTYWNEG